MMAVKILILSCGTNACSHIIRVLKDKFAQHFYLIGTDSNPSELNASINLLDKFYQVPISANPNFPSVLKKIISTEHPNYILPSFDEDQRLLLDLGSLLQEHNVISLGISNTLKEAYSNKRILYQKMSDADLPLPRLYQRDNVPRDNLCFLKPINGVGSKNILSLLGKDITDDLWDSHLVQEICSAPEITIECFNTKNKFSSICRERIATRDGVCVKARVFKSSSLHKLAQQFSKAFPSPIIFNLQVMRNSENRFVITDVNLRPAGGMSISYAAGWDAVSALAQVLIYGENNNTYPSLPDVIPEQFVVRSYQEVITKKNQQVVAFDLDGTLVDSRSRHVEVMMSILKLESINIDISDLISYKRNGKTNVDFLISKGVPSEKAKKIQALWIDKIESSEALSQDMLYPETIDLLKQYSGWTIILITARKNKYGVEETLQRLNLKSFIHKTYVIDPTSDVAKEKANVLIQEKALLFHGDTFSDYQASRLADIDFIYHENGFHDKVTVFGERPN